MAKIIFLLWETAQLNCINLPLDMAAGDLSRKYIKLSDYRMNCKSYIFYVYAEKIIVLLRYYDYGFYYEIYGSYF